MNIKKKPSDSHHINETLPSQFETLPEVLEFITKTLGKRLSRATIFRHWSAGRIADTDGFWQLSDVLDYAATLPDGSVAETPRGRPRDRQREDAVDLARLKLKREVEKLEAQTEAIRFQNDVAKGRYFKKNDVWLELASRAAVLFQGLRQDVLAAGPDVIEAVKASPEKAESVFMAAVERAFDKGIAQYSRPMTLEVETWDGSIDESESQSAEESND